MKDGCLVNCSLIVSSSLLLVNKVLKYLFFRFWMSNEIGTCTSKIRQLIFIYFIMPGVNSSLNSISHFYLCKANNFFVIDQEAY